MYFEKYHAQFYINDEIFMYNIMLLSKSENLSRCSTKLIHFCKKTTTCIRLQGEQIFLVNIYRYFSILGMAFTVLFLCYFQKFQLVVKKKNWTNLYCTVLLYLWAQKMSQVFKILFQTGDIFLSSMVSFLVDMFN